MVNADRDIPTLILGIGNVLWADEGFGVRAVEALRRDYAFAPDVQLLDGGTQGLYLLPYVQAAQRMIVFDAIDYGLPPATIKLVRHADIPAYLGIRKMSLHQSSFQEVLSLAMLLGRYPKHLLLIGVQPEDCSDYGGSLRPAVKARIPDAIALALEQLAQWGVDARPRGTSVSECDPIAIEAFEAGRPSEHAAWRHGDARVVNRRFED